MKENRDCKVCGHQAIYAYSRGNGSEDLQILDVFLCCYCGLLFVGNRISADELSQAYDRMDAKSHYAEIGETTYLKASRALEDLDDLLNQNTGDIALLDVGCGYGHLLDVTAKSYPLVEIFGHELPGDCASACREKGFTIYTGSLEEIRQDFSIITLLDVAEHVAQPNSFFSACRKLLRRHGHIYIHTPRRCFWDTLFLKMIHVPGLKKIGQDWLDRRISIYHLQLWTDKALRLSLQKAGFDLVYMHSTTELSWPLELYTKIFLWEKCHVPGFLLGLLTQLINVLFVRLGMLQNKAICMGRATTY